MSEQPATALEEGAGIAVSRLIGRLLTWTQYEWRVVEGSGREVVIAPFTLGGQPATAMPDRMYRVSAAVAREKFGFEVERVAETLRMTWCEEVDTPRKA